MGYKEENKLKLDNSGLVLSLIRAELGYTQSDFADFLDVPLRKYQDFESGDKLLPLDKAIMICNKWNYSLEQIYFDIEQNDLDNEFEVDIRDYLTVEKESLILSIPDDYWKYLIAKGKIKASVMKDYEKARLEKEANAKFETRTQGVIHRFELPIKDFKDYIFGTELMHWDPTIIE